MAPYTGGASLAEGDREREEGTNSMAAHTKSVEPHGHLHGKLERERERDIYIYVHMYLESEREKRVRLKPQARSSADDDGGPLTAADPSIMHGARRMLRPAPPGDEGRPQGPFGIDAAAGRAAPLQ